MACEGDDMNAWRILALGVATLALVSIAGAQSVQRQGVVDRWAITNFPLFGVAVTPTDSTALAFPMAIRADADGTVTATCVGDGLSGTAVTLNLVAGEFFPCQVIEVQDTGTDAITIHGFY